MLEHQSRLLSLWEQPQLCNLGSDETVGSIVPHLSPHDQPICLATYSLLVTKNSIFSYQFSMPIFCSIAFAWIVSNLESGKHANHPFVGYINQYKDSTAVILQVCSRLDSGNRPHPTGCRT
jgi:hypothetical protein